MPHVSLVFAVLLPVSEAMEIVLRWTAYAPERERGRSLQGVLEEAMRSYEEMVESGDWPPSNREAIRMAVAMLVGIFIGTGIGLVIAEVIR